MFKRLCVCLAISFGILSMTGCMQPKPNIYYWGNYEQLVHDMYLKPGSADAPTQIEKLSSDLQNAESRGLKIHPGLYAQLGFMYALEGRMVEMESAFNQEKSLFPESTIFIDGLLKRAKRQGDMNSVSAY